MKPIIKINTLVTKFMDSYLLFDYPDDIKLDTKEGDV